MRLGKQIPPIGEKLLHHETAMQKNGEMFVFFCYRYLKG